MVPINGYQRTQTTQQNINRLAVATRLRRELHLQEIGKILQDTPLNDSMTQDIRLWYETFSKSIDALVNLHSSETTDAQASQRDVVDRFIDALETLISSFQDPLLGSDGRTYARATVETFQNSTLEPYSSRSPLDPQDAQLFTTRPHTVVADVLRWLHRRTTTTINAPTNVQSEEKEVKVRAESQGSPPTHRNQAEGQREAAHHTQGSAPIHGNQAEEQKEDVRRLRVRAAERRAARTARAATILRLDAFNAAREEVLQATSPAAIERVFAPLRAQTAAGDALWRGGIADLEAIDKEAADRITAVIDTYEHNVAALEEQGTELHKEVNDVQHQVSQAEADNNRIQIALNTLNKLVQEKKKQHMKDILTTVAIIGGCVIATWGLGVLAAGASSGIKGAVIFKGKGAMLKVMIPVSL